jgi:SAM-dependent MidA family methyltransferase
MSRHSGRSQASDEQALSLPAMSAQQQQFSEELQAIIRDTIASNGQVISFEKFMQLALYHPELGYYTSTLNKLGAEGDFITSPEVSELFGRCLANYCEQVLSAMTHSLLIEFGAGTGKLAADILLELERRDSLPTAYWIIELSADLQQRQRDYLQANVPHLLPRVQWHSSLPDEQVDAIVIANEVLDAMPVERFQVDDAIHGMGVTWSEQQQRFESALMEPGEALKTTIESVYQQYGQNWPTGYTSEISLIQPAWIASIAASLKNGVVLLIDYGYGRPEYYLPQRNQGTLMCHYQHRAHGNPFTHIGQQDITAYVDFTHIAMAAVDQGMQLAGYTTQCGFLLENGLETMMPDAEQASVTDMLKFSQQVKTLTMPTEMGERFKVMALSKNLSLNFPGFTLQDQRRRL